jgi:hypothetical protein
MNWLATTVSGNDGLSVAVPIYGYSALYEVRTTLRPYIRSEDMLVIASGNESGSIDVPWVNSAAKALRREFPSNQLAVLASGMTNMVTATNGLDNSVVDAVYYSYEPNFPNEPEFDWDFDVTLGNITQASDIVHSGGFDSGMYVTGRPVLQLRKWAWGWGSYGWDYDVLHDTTDAPLIVQTQTYCADGVERFEDALTKLNRNVSGPWIPQVTIVPGAPNTAPMWLAKQCVDRARWRSLDGIMVWWATDRVWDMTAILKRIGR